MRHRLTHQKGWVDNISFPGVTLLWESQDIGLATGVLGSIRAIGGAVAQTVYVSILTNKVRELQVALLRHSLIVSTTIGDRIHA